MDQNWIKVVKWHDENGRRALGVHNLQNLYLDCGPPTQKRSE